MITLTGEWRFSREDIVFVPQSGAAIISFSKCGDKVQLQAALKVLQELAVAEVTGQDPFRKTAANDEHDTLANQAQRISDDIQRRARELAAGVDQVVRASART